MIRAPLARLCLAALLCSVAPDGFAQQQPQQQRSRTEAKPTQSGAQQRGAPSGAQQKPGAAATSQQKSGTSSSSPQKPGASSAAPQKPAAGAAPAKPGSPAKPGAAAGPGGAQAMLLATFTDWGAYATGQGRAKVCYALSQPKDRQPKDLKRDAGYLFVSFRPADNVRNEVAVVMGFATKDGGPAEATIGTATHGLVTKGANAWVRNPAEENQVIANMSKGREMTVKATSGRGNAASDRYSLSGFAQALDRARKECS